MVSLGAQRVKLFYLLRDGELRVEIGGGGLWSEFCFCQGLKTKLYARSR